MEPEKIISQMDARRALFGLFFEFHNRLQAAGDAFYEEITCKQFFLLACMLLFKDASPPTANEMAEVMGCSRQSVKEILNSLEKKGFILMVTDEADKRKRRITLTEKADEFRARNFSREVDFINGLYDGLTDNEIKATYRVITRLEENLKKMSEE